MGGSRGPAGAGRPSQGGGAGARPGAGAGRPSDRPAKTGGDSFGMGVAKPSAKAGGAKNKNNGNRFNRKDTDELRRPGGKGKGGLFGRLFR